MRWNHPERGLLKPAAFLKVAEDGGQILSIDKFVMHEACRQVRTWQRNRAGAHDLVASVNVSAKQLQHPGVVEEVAEALLVSDLSPKCLVLEVTETAVARDIDDAAATADELEGLFDRGVLHLPAAETAVASAVDAASGSLGR